MGDSSEVKRSISVDLIEDFERKSVVNLISNRLEGQAGFIDYLVNQVKRQQPISVTRLGEGWGNILLARDTSIRDGFLAKHAFK